MPNSLDRFELRDNKPVLTPKGSVLFKRFFAALTGEPVVILSKLPPELRELLERFVRRGVEYLTLGEIRRFYAACSELMGDRAMLLRHQAELVNYRRWGR